MQSVHSIVPNFDDEYSSQSSSKSDSSSDQEDTIPKQQCTTNIANSKNLCLNIKPILCGKSSDEDDEIGDGLRTNVASTIQTDSISHGTHLERSGSMPQVERRRRKLPEIPKNKSIKFKYHQIDLRIYTVRNILHFYRQTSASWTDIVGR